MSKFLPTSPLWTLHVFPFIPLQDLFLRSSRFSFLLFSLPASESTFFVHTFNQCFLSSHFLSVFEIIFLTSSLPTLSLLNSDVFSFLPVLNSRLSFPLILLFASHNTNPGLPSSSSHPSFLDPLRLPLFPSSSLILKPPHVTLFFPYPASFLSPLFCAEQVKRETH